jgi:hypothetical protein
MVVSCCVFVDVEDWADEKDCLRKITGREILAPKLSEERATRERRI